MSVNIVILVGRAGADPEVRYTQEGKAIVNLTLATTETWKSGGERQEHTEWHNVVAFGKLAEIIGEHVTKGKQIFIEGSIRTEKWKDKSGADRRSTKIYAESMRLLGGRSDGKKQERSPSASTGEESTQTAFDDDIPF